MNFFGQVITKSKSLRHEKHVFGLQQKRLLKLPVSCFFFNSRQFSADKAHLPLICN